MEYSTVRVITLGMDTHFAQLNWPKHTHGMKIGIRIKKNLYFGQNQNSNLLIIDYSNFNCNQKFRIHSNS